MSEPHITSARPGFYCVHAHYDEEIEEIVFHAHVVEAWSTVDITQEGKEEEFAVMPMVFQYGRYAQLLTVDPGDDDFVGVFFSQITFENTRGAPVVSEDDLRKDHVMFTEIVDEWDEHEEDGDEESGGITREGSPSMFLNPTMIPDTPPGLFLRMDDEDEEN